MIDTHCHLDQYKEPLRVAEQAERQGIITIGVTHLPSAFEIEFPVVRRFRKIRIALGLHPLMVEHHAREKAAFRKLASETAFIGEVGLDYSTASIADKKQQLDSFSFVLETLASLKTTKFITVHSRKAEQDVLSCLQHFGVLGAVLHWYSGPLGLLDKALSDGHFFSINPEMIASKKGQQIVARLPKERILSETDGPYTSIGNRPTRPDDVRSILIYLSELWSIPLAQVSSILHENFMRIVNETKSANGSWQSQCQ